MERTSAWTKLCTLSGLFREGTQAGGVAPTPLTAGWLNAVQEELANVIEAYLPALDKGDNTQLLQAIQKAYLDYYTKLQIDNFLVKLAPLDSAALTGEPSAPTPPFGARTKQLVNAEFVQDAVAALVDSSPGTLDTLKELALALGNDPNFATTITSLIGGKASKATTLAGYGIGDAYTKDAADVLLLGKQDNSEGLMQENGFHLCRATGKLQQWGVATVGPDSISDPINFPAPFAQLYVCFGNKVTPNSVDGDGNAAGACAVSVTQYKVFNDSDKFSAIVHWTAIGKATGY
ncbi:gp53-like domain-containing protein [Pseudomonas taetrolens]|uniref:gp53-like domain-containing protein n=1 Tax=Pseudomonas taetrolens TaxID=47884 RepID=UPI0030DD9978